MNELKRMRVWLFVLLGGIFLFSCGEDKPTVKDIVKKPEQLTDRVKENLKSLVEYAGGNSGKLNDSAFIHALPSVQQVYGQNGYTALWSSQGNFAPLADSLYNFIAGSKEYGLFPADFNYSSLKGIHAQLQADTLAKKDAALWSRADVMLTDALLVISQQLKRGRLPYDTLTSRKDTLVTDKNYYINILGKVTQSNQLISILQELEPALDGYKQLRKSAAAWLDTTTFRKYSYLPFPSKDSATFNKLLRRRLSEENIFDSLPPSMDTSLMRKAIAAYQSSHQLKVTGKINENTAKSLNNTDWERFKRFAISLDKYKLMADTLPPIYVWVNIPSYQLKLVQGDSIALESKVIVGAPKTRTPELYSEISNFITYPQWTVPYSIVFKEMLPRIQKDINYLKKQNLMIVDRYDSVIDPAKIDWSKLSKNKFPYQIRQRQGDDNSLGVLKFNFRNKYSVYLHDTNARWMFSKTMRSLSHGCVRVQQWEKLARYLVRNDSVRYNTDTLSNWIKRQEKHVVSGFKRVPLFIRYFTVEAKDGRIRFYDDIYAEDEILAERYFSRNIN